MQRNYGRDECGRDETPLSHGTYHSAPPGSLLLVPSGFGVSPSTGEIQLRLESFSANTGDLLYRTHVPFVPSSFQGPSLRLQTPHQPLLGQNAPGSSSTQGIQGPTLSLQTPHQPLLGQNTLGSSSTQGVQGPTLSLQTPHQPLLGQNSPGSSITQGVQGPTLRLQTPHQPLLGQNAPGSFSTQGVQGPTLRLQTPQQPLLGQNALGSSSTQGVQGPTLRLQTPHQQLLVQNAPGSTINPGVYTLNWIPPSYEVARQDPPSLHQPLDPPKNSSETLKQLLSLPVLDSTNPTVNHGGTTPTIQKGGTAMWTPTTHQRVCATQGSPQATPIIIQPITSPRTPNGRNLQPQQTSTITPGQLNEKTRGQTYQLAVTQQGGMNVQEPPSPYQADSERCGMLASPPAADTQRRPLIDPVRQNVLPKRHIILHKLRGKIEKKLYASKPTNLVKSNVSAPQSCVSTVEGNVEFPKVGCIKEEPCQDDLNNFLCEKDNINNQAGSEFEKDEISNSSPTDSNWEKYKSEEPKLEPISPIDKYIKEEPKEGGRLGLCECQNTSLLSDHGKELGLCNCGDTSTVSDPGKDTSSETERVLRVCSVKENASPENTQRASKETPQDMPALPTLIKEEPSLLEQSALSDVYTSPTGDESHVGKRKLFEEHDVLNTAFISDDTESSRSDVPETEKRWQNGINRKTLSVFQQSKTFDNVSGFRTPSVPVEKNGKALPKKKQGQKRKLFQDIDVFNTAFLADDMGSPYDHLLGKGKPSKRARVFTESCGSHQSESADNLSELSSVQEETFIDDNQHCREYTKASSRKSLFQETDVFNTAFIADDNETIDDYLQRIENGGQKGVTTKRTVKGIKKAPTSVDTKKAKESKTAKEREPKKALHYSANDYDFYFFFETSSEDEQPAKEKSDQRDEDWMPDPEPEPEFVNRFKKKKKKQNKRSRWKDSDSENEGSDVEKKQVFECDQCERTFDDCWASLCAHRLQEHPSVVTNTCEICHVACCNDAALTEHMSEVHSVTGFGERILDFLFCPDCDEKHPQSLTYIFHREESHECCVLSCNLCDFTAHHRFQMKTHMQKVHNETDFMKYKGNVTLTKVATREIPITQCIVPYSCCLCGEKLKRGEGMKHKLEKHAEEMKLGIYHCVVCEKVFDSLQAMNSHFLTHFQGPRCPFCQAKFRNYGKDYREHIKMLHCGLRHTYCEKCNVILTRQKGTQHFKLVHEDQRRHLCSVCGRRFKSRHAYKVHNLIHTGEKPIHCDLCSYRCRQRTALNWHMRKTHSDHEHKETTSDENFNQKKWCYKGRPPGKALTKKNSNVKVQELKSPEKQAVLIERQQNACKRRRPGRPKGKSQKNNGSKNKNDKEEDD